MRRARCFLWAWWTAMPPRLKPGDRRCHRLGAGDRGNAGDSEICDVTVGLRVTTEEETEGLDLSLHGEEGYTLEGA